MKKFIGYAGIVDDKIDITLEYSGENPEIYSIYPKLKTAKKFYQKVVKVEIKILK